MLPASVHYGIFVVSLTCTSRSILNKAYKSASRWGMRDQERNER